MVRYKLMGVAAAGLLLLTGAGWCEAPAVQAPAAQATAGQPEAEQALSLTPQAAADMAVKNSLDLQINAQDVAAAYAELKQIYAENGWRADVSASHVRMGPIVSVTLPNNGGSVTFGSPKTTTESLSVTKPLYVGGRVSEAARAARAGIQVTTVGGAITRLAIQRAAQERAYGVLRAMQFVSVAEQLAGSNQEHLRISQAMFDAGVTPRFEVVQAQTELANAQGQVIAAQATVEQAIAGLRQVLAVPQTTPVTVIEGPAPTAAAGTLPDLIQQALLRRPEIAAARAGVTAAEAGIGIARASRDFTVGLAGTLQHESTSSTLSAPITWNVGVQLSKNIFDSGLGKAHVAQAVAKWKAAQVQVDVAGQQVALDVTQQHITVSGAARQVDVARQGVANSEERLRIANVRFAAGVTPGIEVIDAQIALAGARATLVNAQYDLQVAIMKLNNAIVTEPVTEEKQ